MNSLDYLESKRIRQNSTKKIKDPPQPSLFREGANTSETGIISICDSNNSLPKQGGLGWVSPFFNPSPQNIDIQSVVCRGEYFEVVRNVVGTCGDAEEKRENFWRLVFMFVLLHLLSKGIV